MWNQFILCTHELSRCFCGINLFISLIVCTNELSGCFSGIKLSISLNPCTHEPSRCFCGINLFISLIVCTNQLSRCISGIIYSCHLLLASRIVLLLLNRTPTLIMSIAAGMTDRCCLLVASLQHASVSQRRIC